MKYNLHLDKLKLTYSITANTYKYLDFDLHGSAYGVDGMDYTIKRVPTTLKHTKQYQLSTKTDNGDFRHFATLLLDDNFIDEQINLCSIQVENWAFYTPFYPLGSPLSDGSSIAGAYLDHITADLGLRLHSIDRLDIAIDLTRADFVGLVRSAMRKYTTVVNGTPYPTLNEKIQGVKSISSLTRKKLIDTSLYFEQESRAVLTIYDKTAELKDNPKDYITATLDPTKKTYRVEVRLKSKAIGEYIHRIRTTLADLYIRAVYLEDSATLVDLVNDYTYKLLHFIKSNGEVLGIFDLSRPLTA